MTATGGRDKTLIHPSKIKTDLTPARVSFRISCKCTGSLSQYFSAQVEELFMEFAGNMDATLYVFGINE